MMNDRFRFRVWNKENKEMIYNAEIAYDGMNYNTSWQIGKNTNDGWVECFGYYLDYPEEYEVMQCTGLKDKNGKLIYELDYVRYSNNKYKVGIDKFLGISLTNILNGDTIIMDDIVLFNCEVIGNEFESNTKI